MVGASRCNESQGEVCMSETPDIVSKFNRQGCFAKGEAEGLPRLRAECFGVWQGDMGSEDGG